MKNNHSEEWCISAEFARQNIRLLTALIIVVIMWIVTIVSWVASDHIINNEAIDCAQAHEVNICKDSLQTSGKHSSGTAISPIQNKK